MCERSRACSLCVCAIVCVWARACVRACACVCGCVRQRVWCAREHVCGRVLINHFVNETFSLYNLAWLLVGAAPACEPMRLPLHRVD